MKLYHYSLVFMIIALPLLVSVWCKSTEIGEIGRYCRETEAALDKAVNAAAKRLKEKNELILPLAGTDINRSALQNSLDEIADCFFTALAASFGNIGDGAVRAGLERYVPVMAVTLPQGIYVRCEEEFAGEDGSVSLIKRWTGPFYGEIADVLDSRFDFSESDRTYTKKMSGSGVAVIFSDYRIPGTDRSYTCLSLAGTGIEIKEMLYINQEGENYASNRYYHRESCEYRKEYSSCLHSAKECAYLGANPCPYCCGDYGDCYYDCIAR